jgi:plasmid stabilization system protein ParE
VKLKTIITAPARLEIAEAVKYYEQQRQRPSAGVRFWLEFKLLVKRLKGFPELYPGYGRRGIRKAPMHNYPHSVYYRVVGDELRLLGVVHGAMNPKTVKSRFK